MENEQSGFVESAFRHCGRQIWYGVNNDNKGFVGLVAQMLTDADHVINAGGAEDKKSSVFFASLGSEKIEVILGAAAPSPLIRGGVKRWRR